MKSLLFLFSALLIFACNNPGKATQTDGKTAFQNSLDSFVKTKKAKIGVAIISPDGKDTFSVNGSQKFTMMSVVKFPQALFVLSRVEKGLFNLDTMVRFDSNELNRDTWSPLAAEHRHHNYPLPLLNCFYYSVGKSDNIACDKLYDFGPIPELNQFIEKLGTKNFKVAYKYKDMKVDSIGNNYSSPLDMAILFRQFEQGQILKTALKDTLMNIMYRTQSGPNRLSAGVPKGVAVAHKTGTYYSDSTFIQALNDAGLVKTSDGRHYTIVVFVNDSRELEEGTAAIISEINRMAYRYFNKN